MKILFTLILLLCYGTLSAQENGWYKQSIPTNQYLPKIFFLNKDTGWTGGQEGLYWTTNGGNVWQLLTTKAVSDPTFVDGKNGWGITGNKTVGKTTDGGITWKDTLTKLQGGINELQIFGFDTVYLSGDVEFTWTTDRGETWHITTGLAPSYDMHFTNNKIGYRCGGAYLWFEDFPPPKGTRGAIFEHTIDGGRTWNRKFPFIEGSTTEGLNEDLRGIFACDSLNIFVAGSKVVSFSSNGGSSWRFVLNPGGAFDGLYFFSPTTGYMVGYGGKIFFTNDTGKTWTQQISGTKQWLYSVEFIDSLSGWVSGDSGTILHTTDGGKLWTRQYLPKPLTTSVSPEPFGRKTSITYELPSAMKVKIRIYDVLGKELEVLESPGIEDAGTHSIEFDGSRYPEGTFHYRIETEGFYGTGKMTKVVY